MALNPNECYTQLKQILKSARDVSEQLKEAQKILNGSTRFQNDQTIKLIFEDYIFTHGSGVKRYTLLAFLLKNEIPIDERITLSLIEPNLNLFLSDGTLPLSSACMLTEPLILVDFFLKNNANPNIIDKFGWTPLVYATYYRRMNVPQILIQAGANVNVVFNFMGKNLSLLQFAIVCDQFDLAKQIVEQLIANNNYAPIFICQNDVNTQRHSANKKITKKINIFSQYLFQEISKLLTEENKNTQELISTLTLSEIKNIPFTKLNLNINILNALSSRLLAILEKANFSLEIKNTLTELLNSNTKHKQYQLVHISTFNILNLVAELADILENPYLIDQSERPLCGPASALTLLTKVSPNLLVNLSLELILNCKIYFPFKLSLSVYSKTQSISLVDVLLTEIRRSLTDNFNTYSPTSVLACVQALTPPGLMYALLEKFGFQDVSDLTVILKANAKSELSKPQKALIYMAFHAFQAKKKQDKFLLGKGNLKQNLEMIIKTKQSNEKEVILFLSVDLMNKILARYLPTALQEDFLKQEAHPLLKLANQVLGMSVDHYVYLNSCNLIKNEDEDEYVEMELLTWGSTLNVYLPIDEFLQGYRGAILTTSRIKPTVATKPSML